MEKSPYKMYNIEDCELKPLFKEIKGIKEPYNQCRQLLPKTYIHNGYIDLIKTEIVEKKFSITGDRIYPYLMSKEEYHDIDTEEDWKDAEK
jgi:N-acylneuraminate cytidylyltransferase